MILFVTTADTDLLTADRALEGLPNDFPEVRAFNPANLPPADLTQEGEQNEILTAAAIGSVAIVMTLILVFAASKLIGKNMADLFR